MGKKIKKLSDGAKKRRTRKVNIKAQEAIAQMRRLLLKRFDNKRKSPIIGIGNDKRPNQDYPIVDESLIAYFTEIKPHRILFRQF